MHITHAQLLDQVGSLVRVSTKSMYIEGDLFWNDLHQWYSISVYGRDGFDRNNSAYVKFTISDITNYWVDNDIPHIVIQ